MYRCNCRLGYNAIKKIILNKSNEENDGNDHRQLYKYPTLIKIDSKIESNAIEWCKSVCILILWWFVCSIGFIVCNDWTNRVLRLIATLRLWLADNERNKKIEFFINFSNFLFCFFIFQTDNLIYRLPVQRVLEVGPEWTEDNGVSTFSSIQFEVRVTCDTHYYGDGCGNLCRPRDDQFGHYTCSSTGSIVCLSGWQDDYCTKRKFLFEIKNRKFFGIQ